MPDSVAERRKRGKPERAKPMNEEMRMELDALRAANVSPRRLARALSKRYGSVAEQRAALKALATGQSGGKAGELKYKRK